MINTRVCIDDMLGPFDCQLDPGNRWNGWLSPHFTLAATRELSAQTLRMADEYGYDSVDTIHVIEGRADSQDTVHLIESDLTREVNEDGVREPIALAVRVPWRSLDRGATATLSGITPAVRKAARKSKVTGRGAARAVVVHVRWQWMDEESDTAANVVQSGQDGRYSIGGWEWTWGYAIWWCACGSAMVWHETDCTGCLLRRDNQPVKKPCDCGCDPAQGTWGEYDLESVASRAHFIGTGRFLRWSESAAQPNYSLEVATEMVGVLLRRLAPGATSALVDLTGPPSLIAVFAGDAEIDTADDTGPFDSETLGGADEILRHAMDQAGPDAAAAGWQLVPDEKSQRLYRITFPADRP
ncbi:hypothetical protein [Actinacidiphila sp. ITFR-21]|uniref:hypothetical protein n=1 Tax=Actinacidiphila sp. ITFR-21 TaxID=3075199 RepID=UPI0028891253|nr:hypothetical protein [Streptomyces sp. ITFR-21]WNI20386.1 hypothetical protein RLT57_32805 [Streptomyces sp. ITFR-21]